MAPITANCLELIFYAALDRSESTLSKEGMQACPLTCFLHT
jgi:hypothetical protein